MSQQQQQERELRRSSRRRNRKSYSDYFSHDDTLTEHEDDNIEEEELEEEEYEDGSDNDYIQEEQEEESVSGDCSDNYNGEEQEAHKASVKDINPKFACGLCSNILSDPYIIPACCHRFCCKCIQESIKAGVGPCPTCRDHSVSFESLRRDEMMGRLLARYKMLQEKIQKKRIEEEKHETHKKGSLEIKETIQEESDRLTELATRRTRKKRKIESSSNENSSETNRRSERKATKQRAQVKSSSGKKVAAAPENKKRKAKSSNDVLTFNERLRCLRDFKKKYGHINVPKDCSDLSCHEGLGRWCSTMRLIRAGTCKQFSNPEFKLTQKRMKVLEDMGFRWTITQTFDEYLYELKAFKERYGHCIVPKEYKANKTLGNWCSRLRLMKSGTRPNTGNSKLTPERIKRLEKLGFRWRIKSQRSQGKMEANVVESANGNAPSDVAIKKFTRYEKALEKTIERKDQSVEEHSMNKQSEGSYDDNQTITILQKGKRKKKSMVTTLKGGNKCQTGSNANETRKRKKQKLDEMKGLTFEERLELMEEYKQIHGHCNIPKTYTENGMGSFCEHIRQSRLKRTHINGGDYELTKEMIEKLSNLGFTWKFNRSFDDNYRALLTFKQKKGHCNVTSSNYKEDPALVNWVFRIRTMRAGTGRPYTSSKTKLTKARIAKLDALGFEWAPGPSYQDEIFEDYVRDLKDYKAKHGDCYVSTKEKNNMKLGHWVSKLRRIRAGKLQPVNHQSLQLNEERIIELDRIGFQWNSLRTFDEHMDDLRQFKAKHGHCNVPYVYQEKKSLGFWVGDLRKKKFGTKADSESPDHKLTEERIAQLDKMGFNWKLRL